MTLLKDWLSECGHDRDYAWLAEQLKTDGQDAPKAESLRQIVNGYRPAGWRLAFRLEALTGIPAVEIKGAA